MRAEADQMAKYGGESIAETYRKMALEMEKEREVHPDMKIGSDAAVDWPDDSVPNNSISVQYDLDRNFEAKLVIGLAPTRNCWEVPAYIPFGGFNACPFPEVHVAMLRHWQQTYAAELVTMTHDTIEVEVGRRPQTREEAMRLANDQMTYAEFDQSLYWSKTENLAASLLISPVWQFWWD